ncbi:MAG: restriction endonuclease subunit M [Desulfuromonas sp.]|nr:MAG: restriction endonuclease subunit M [Desulfuromonas sp.]
MKHYPVIPWIGGKRRLAKEILPLLPPHSCYVEPFCGAAAILFLKEPSRAEVINDVHGELVNLYRVVQHHLEEFCRQFKHALVSRQIFGWLQQTPPHVLTDIQRAARFFFLQKMSFGGKVSGQTFGTSAVQPPRLNLLRLEEDLSQAHLRLSRVTIEHLDWQRCVEKYDRPETLFFADPPYWQTEGYGVDFPLEQYHAIAGAMRTMKGKMILTVNDHPDMRRIFAGFAMKTVGINYTVGGADKGKGRKELIIWNWGG